MDWNIAFMNFIYTLMGSSVALIVMALGYKLFDAMTPFDTHEELTKGNRAVGSVVASIFIGLGIAVGLVVGMSFN
ncbi:DUF350 domain-containing protein [Pleionea sp. CnH1-48]|uniref:DUF350 domain-containing protein n=1 Tax=Pleionea sp. CnH1-48 TaxID=2954494 RepID=UPI00209805D2|nr:DUF350 domain-containing protein [Pleionea sp. CnH1-48]MCO7226414.1 DUF350 domain-containing protein [Pleionea sp. CnH1-48]